MVVVRLARGGSKKRPFYHVVVADKRSPRDGKYIQRLGYFNPVAVGGESKIVLDREAISTWIAKGAQLSERVTSLVKQFDASASSVA